MHTFQSTHFQALPPNDGCHYAVFHDDDDDGYITCSLIKHIENLSMMPVFFQSLFCATPTTAMNKAWTYL